jgi:cobalt-zinc-cadmium efflux system outer membrane protein
MSGRRILTVFAIVTLARSALQAQGLGQERVAQYIDARAGLGVEEAVARALAREPSIQAVRADVDVARGDRVQAGLRPNPALSVEHRGEPRGTDTLTTITVEWPLDLFRRTGRVQTADRAVEIARFCADDRARILVADVRMQYGAAAAAVREMVVAEELWSAARQQLDLVRARVDAGSAPPLERDLLEVEVRRLDAARQLAVGRTDAALVQLKPWLGMDPQEPLRLRDSLDSLVGAIATRSPAPETVAPTGRPDVKEADAQVALADARIDQARREGRADVSVFSSYMRMDNGFPQQGIGPAGALERVRGRFRYVSAGATIALPVLNRNQGQLAAAEADRRGAEARRAAIDLAARAEVAAATLRDGQAQRALAIYRDGLRDLARRNLDVVRQTFELGRATVFDVLAEQKRWLDVEQGYTAAAREAWDARVAWERAMGETK